MCERDTETETDRQRERENSRYVRDFCCCCSTAKSCPNLCNPMNCSTLDFSVLHYFLEFDQTQIHWVGNALQPSHPLSSPPLLHSAFPSIRVFPVSWLFTLGGQSIGNFSFSIIPANEYSGLILFRIDWLDLAVQGTLKSFPALQFESINSLALNLLYCPILTSVHDYWKNRSFGYTDLCRQSLLFNINTLSRFVIAFLQRKHLLISWL